MSTWTPAELDTIGTAEELRIGTMRRTVLVNVPIWVVRVDDALYVRSYRGPKARWHTRATAQRRASIDSGGITRDVDIHPIGDELRQQIDTAYRQKYRRYGDA